MIHNFVASTLVFLLSFVLTSFLTKAIPRLKIRQIERDEGLESHKSKSGTPTMGGIGFIIAAAAATLIIVDRAYVPLVFLFLGYSLVGLLDDSIKTRMGRNLGLTFWQKIIIQTIFAAIFVVWTGSRWPLFAVFLIVGTGNATNLTDGLDGLLSGCAILAFASFGYIALKQGLFGGAAFSCIFALALLGFIFFNFPKARIFMGDTGSLGIGAALAGLAVLIHREFALAVVGGVFLVEALSVIIQVGSYKIWKKRVFKMAPLHHHFELLGFNELQVVFGFWSAQAALSLIGAILL